MKKIFLVILLFILGLGGYILYGKVFDNKDVKEDINYQDDDSINSNWINYLLSSEILEIKIRRVRSIDLGDDYDLNKTVTITKEDLKDILYGLKDTKLFKTYSPGIGGPVADHLIISYKYNEEIYKFEIYYGSIFIDNVDEELKQIFNDNNYEEKYTEYKDIGGAFYFYSIDNYSSTIFDVYFK